MTRSSKEAPPERGPAHDALDVFLGEWEAEGTTFGGPGQSTANPRGGASPWRSTHTARWHSGKFFLIQEEKANGPFDTHSILGIDARTGQYFASTFENHGFHRHYSVQREGNTWVFTGETERARHVFSEDGNTQTIHWEWKPGEDWLPLCDRLARKVR